LISRPNFPSSLDSIKLLQLRCDTLGEHDKLIRVADELRAIGRARLPLFGSITVACSRIRISFNTVRPAIRACKQAIRLECAFVLNLRSSPADCWSHPFFTNVATNRLA
jgi:hypothetical protein